MRRSAPSSSSVRFGPIGVALAVLFAHIPLAAAQTAELSAAATTVHAAAGSVGILDLREGDLTADLRFSVIPRPSGALDVAMHVRAARGATVGGLGAATVELVAAGRTDGRGSARLSGQGVLGPASVRFGVTAANAPPGAFTVTGLAPTDTSLRMAGAFVAIDATVRYRVDRTFLLAIEPAVAWGEDGASARGRTSLRARRLSEDFDGVVAVHAHLLPSGGWSGAIGVGAVWAPRRAPEWHATLWLGWLEGTVTPGITVEGSATLAPGVSLALSAAAEPFRADVPKFRGAAEVEIDVGAHRAFAAVEAQGGPAAHIAVATGMRFSVGGTGR